MRRFFPILAGVAGLLLVASLVAGLAGSTEGHPRIGWVAVAATLTVHSSAFAHLRATGRRVEATAGALGLPDWVGAQAEKNRRKAFVYEGWGSALAVLTAMSGAGRWWHLALSGSSLSFQVGAFVGEFAIIAAQSRLMRDVGSWAGPA